MERKRKDDECLLPHRLEFQKRSVITTDMMIQV